MGGDEEGRRGRRSTRYNGDYQLGHFSDIDTDEEDRPVKKNAPKPKALGKARLKECPGCSAMVAVAVKECSFCDYVFTSKSMLMGSQTAAEESQSIRERFPFEPEREEDGSLKIQLIFGRRPRKQQGHRYLTKAGTRGYSAMDSKFDYEYLVKYKTMSYLHVQWLSAHEIDMMNPRSKMALHRYLNKIDKGDPTVQEDGEFDASYTEVEKVLDMREEEVTEIQEDTEPAIQEATGGAVMAISSVPDTGRSVSSEANNSNAPTSSEAVESSEAPVGPDGEVVVLAKTQIWKPLERCRRVLERIWDDPYATSFHEPVDVDEFDDYLDVVSDPICLQDVKRKLDNNEYKNQYFMKFVSDMRQIFRNCKIYNMHKSQIWHCAHTLSLMLERLFQAWVLSYQDATVYMHEPIARPWESSCRGCEADEDEDKMILCDHCDAAFHIYCVTPKMTKVPEGSWVCQRCSDWLSKSGAKLLSAAVEDEARRVTEAAGSLKVVHVKKRKYLVKWVGLSYRDCTWETPEDINDDQKIKEYHELNDAPPDEPPLTQAEIGIELSKDRKSQLYPAFSGPSAMREAEAAIYSQIRAYHFLRWNTVPPDALAKECGITAFAGTYGARIPMALPACVKKAVDSVNGVHVKEEVSESMEVDQGAEAEAENSEDEHDSPPHNNVSSYYSYTRPIRGLTRDEVADAAEAAREAQSVTRGLKSRKNTTAQEHYHLTYYTPPDANYVLDEVANVLSGVVHAVARGIPPASFPTRPKLLDNEIEVCVAKGSSGLFMNIGDYKDRVVVLGFRKMPNGKPGPAEMTGKIKAGDVIVGINGVYLAHLGFQQIIRILSAKGHTYLYLRLLRIAQDVSAPIDPYLKARIEEKVSLKPRRERSQYFGVYPAGDKSWRAEVVHNYKVEEIGVYDDELSAAKAYDARAVEIFGGAATVNFRDGKLTSDAVVLSDNVAEEREFNRERLQYLLETTGDEEFDENYNKLNDVHSDDSLDSDSEVEESSESSDSSSEGRASSDEDDWDSDTNRDGEWRPKDEVEVNGPLGRLIRAVNQTDYPPLRSEWANYILELGQRDREGGLMRKVEQIDMASQQVIRTWNSINQASRALNIPSHAIMAVLRGKTDMGGGFMWKYARAADEDEEEEGEETKKDESWKSKLYEEGKEYANGGRLRDYQVEGLNWLLRCWYNKRSSILADEMGLGKTVQVVAFLDHLCEVENIRGPFLIAVPLSTLEHWKREAEGWSKMTVCLYHDAGGGRDMRDVIREYEWYYKGRSRRLLKFQILITTYDDLIKDYEELAEVPWRAVIVDEAHRMRNASSKLIECMRSVASKGQVAYGYQHRVLMTGTPLQNNTAELFSLLNFIEPAKFPDAEKFNQKFGSIQTQEQVETLQRRIAPHLLRRVKEDVAKDIPPKQETIIDVELTTMQKQYYRAIFEHNMGFLMQGTKGSLPRLMNIQMELRKCCNHPFLITGVEQKEMEDLEDRMIHDHNMAQPIDNKVFDAHRIEECMIPQSGKMVLLDKLLPKLKREGHKVLIFSQMVKMLDFIEEFCEHRQYSHERLDGRVQGNDRQKAIDRFNKTADSFVFLLSTRAGGVGINLTAADTVIIFDSDWNPQNDIQAMARCHRIGQSKNVTIYRLITRRSFESEMFERASRKLGLEQALLGSRQFGDADVDEANKSNAKMDSKEVESLLRHGAYAALMDDDAEAVKEFCEQDIDSILDQRAHVRVVEGAQTDSWLNKRKSRASKSMFTGESAMEHAEIDVNDPDFWKKVLPDLVTPDIMLDRLGVLVAMEEDDDEAGFNDALDKFMADMTQLIDGMSDLKRRNQLPDRERALCMKLLLRMTLKTDTFSPEQCSLAQDWLTSLEGSRRRATRVDKEGDHAPVRRRRRKKSEMPPKVAKRGADTDYDDEEDGRRRRRRGRPSKADSDMSSDDFEDEDAAPSRGRPRSSRGRASTGRGGSRSRRTSRGIDEDVEDGKSLFQKKAKAMRAIRMSESLRAPLSTKPPSKRGRKSAKQLKIESEAAGEQSDDFVESDEEASNKRMRLSIKVGDEVVDKEKAALMLLHGKRQGSDDEDMSMEEDDDFDPYSTFNV